MSINFLKLNWILLLLHVLYYIVILEATFATEEKVCETFVLNVFSLL